MWVFGEGFVRRGLPDTKGVGACDYSTRRRWTAAKVPSCYLVGKPAVLHALCTRIMIVFNC